MKVVYSLHAEEKLQFPEIRKLGVKKNDLERVLDRPDRIDDSEKPVLIAIKGFNRDLSLCVVYKHIKGGVKIITFYPTEKGRYERKILQRG